VLSSHMLAASTNTSFPDHLPRALPLPLSLDVIFLGSLSGDESRAVIKHVSREHDDLNSWLPTGGFALALISRR
jgi:hypothetical protein